MDDDIKWLAIMWIGIAFACVLGLSVQSCSENDKELIMLQSECIRLGYGEYVDGKFVMKGE